MAQNKVKILFTIPNFDTAGSGKVVYDLAKNLDKEKFDVSIACRNSKGIFFTEIKSLNLPIYFLEITVPIKPYFTFLSRIKPFKNFIKENKFNIVHSWHWSSDWSEVVASRLGKAKFIYTKKSMSWGNLHWKIRSFFSNHVIITNHEMNHFLRNKRNKSIIPFGVDTDYFRKESIKSIIQKENFNIITVANLVPVKAIEDIIKAIHLLNTPQIKLNIIGSDCGDYPEYLKKTVAELGLEKQVKFLGKHTDVRPFQNNSDLYIISSQKEGLPVALLEAMSMSLPVLGSNIPGIRFVLEDFNKLLFEQGNYHQLAEKIIYFYKMSTQERVGIGQKLRKHCEDNFSLKMFIQKHEELYLKIVKK
jgi:glycosyltransferase involved in cell wall biosynthesis